VTLIFDDDQLRLEPGQAVVSHGSCCGLDSGEILHA
jgi:hypothetical protein